MRDVAAMIAGMAPRLDPEVYVFCTAPDDKAAVEAVGMFREAEGVSLILPERVARRLGFEVRLPMRRITLEVHSALDGVGLTAAVAVALAEAGIACNMVAAYHHDHAFVPAARAEEAITRLRSLSRGGCPSD